MEQYDSYKDSGVDWIGGVPSHWATLKNKYFTLQRKDKSKTGEEDLLSVSEYHGVIPRRVIRDGEEHLSRSETFEGYLKVSPGELVSNIMLMWKTGLGVSEFEGLVSPAYSVFRFSSGSPKYFHYLFRTSQYTSEYRRNSTGVIDSRLRLYDDSFGGLSSHFPPLQEQEQIVEYLDRKTTLIDSLIEKTVRKIELLKEKRTSLINEVVTKGLNPDVEMKDSGVEWIGEIPSHWTTPKLSFYCEVKDGTHSTPTYVDDGYPLVTQKDITKGKLDFSKTKNISKEDYDEINRRSNVVYGDIIMSMIGSIGNPTIVDTETPFSIKNVCLFKTSESNERTKFIHYFLNSSVLMTELELKSRGGVQGFVSLDVLRNISFIKPPLSEQQQIVEYLDEQTSIINSTITTEEKRIELLKEYRQSLISEVVTGKVKVTSDE